MGMNALVLTNKARNALGFSPDLTTLVGNTSALQFLALLEESGRDLISDRDWTMLSRVTTLQTVDPLETTGDTTMGAATLTNVADITGLDQNWAVTGQGISVGARVLSAAVTTVTTDSRSFLTETGIPLTFSRDTFAMPDDFRKFINQTQWDRTNNWPLNGPVSPQEYQWAASGIVTIGPRSRFRQVSLESGLPGIRLWPPPSAQDTPATLSYEYTSAYWVLSNASPPVRKGSITADTDTFLFPDDLLIAALKMRMWRANGFDSTALEQDYVRIKTKVAGNDGGSRVVSASRRRYPFLIGPGNIPDGNWPGAAS